MPPESVNTSQHRHVHPRSLVAIAVFLICLLGLISCGTRSGTGQLVLQPATVTVPMGGTVSFSATFKGATPSGAEHFSWRVDPARGGSISDQGVYATGMSAGDYTVTATWTSQTLRYTGTAAVKVLPTPQTNAVITPDLVQASGGLQTSGALENVPVLGEPVPAQTSSDQLGITQIRHGFDPPLVCGNSGPNGTTKQCSAD
jgi:hypothetical protein